MWQPINNIPKRRSPRFRLLAKLGGQPHPDRCLPLTKEAWHWNGDINSFCKFICIFHCFIAPVLRNYIAHSFISFSFSKITKVHENSNHKIIVRLFENIYQITWLLVKYFISLQSNSEMLSSIRYRLCSFLLRQIRLPFLCVVLPHFLSVKWRFPIKNVFQN